MKIKWFGQSCFLLTAADGARLLMDPFKSDNHLSYKQVNEKADLVTVSHEHFDHSHTSDLPGKPEVEIAEDSDVIGLRPEHEEDDAAEDPAATGKVGPPLLVPSKARQAAPARWAERAWAGRPRARLRSSASMRLTTFSPFSATLGGPLPARGLFVASSFSRAFR